MMTFLSMWLLSHLDNSSSKAEPPPPQESREWMGYSVALHVLLPVAGFCILWGRRDLLTRLLLHIDRSCIAVCCPSFSKREKLLKWASENLPYSWSSPSKTLSGGIPDLWKDGSLLCTLINMAVPGACSNPPKHWKKPPTHAQALAYKYFGIVPVFTEKEFEAIFSSMQERKFLFYLQELEQAMKKYNAREQSPICSSKYLAKGMGLQTGEQHRKTIFYIYANTSDSNTNNILVYIRGPYGTQGTATIPAFYNLNSLHGLKYLHKHFRPSDKIILKKERRKSFLRSIALDFSSFVNLEKKVLANDVPIQIDMEENRAKIAYIPSNFGIYEVNLITNGEVIAGSPFSVSIFENISDLQDSFETPENIIKQIPVSERKKIISRVIDCIDEKIEWKNNVEGQTIEEIAAALVVPRESETPDTSLSLDSIEETLSCDSIQSQTVMNNGGDKLTDIRKDLLENLEQNYADHNLVINEPMLDSSKFTTLQKNIRTVNNETLPPATGTISTESNHARIVGRIDAKSPEPLSSSVLIKTTMNQMNKLPFNRIDSSSKKILDKESMGFESNGKIDPIASNGFQGRKELYRGIQKNANPQSKTIVLSSRNRPTSIVSPFLKQAKCEVNNEKRTNQDEQDSPLMYERFLTTEESLLAIGRIETPYENKSTTILSNFNSSENSTNQTLQDLQEEKTYENYSSVVQEFAPEELLLSIRQNKVSIQNKYVENLKTILTNKLKLQCEDSTRLKSFVSTTKDLKYLNDIPLTQENVHIIPIVPDTSPICPAHIVPEVETLNCKDSDSEKLSLAEKRSFFSKHHIQHSNSTNSSISKEENEDVSPYAGSPNSSLRILSVMESIKKSNLNRNFSKSSPNMLESQNIYSACSSSIQKTTFQKTREYWKNMSMIDLTGESPDLESKRISFFKSKTLPVPGISREIHKSADDLSTSAKYNFRNIKLQRCSSWNQKEFEAVEFISIDERKKQLLQDKFEEEYLGSRFVKKCFFTKAKSGTATTIEETKENSGTEPPFKQRRIHDQQENTAKTDTKDVEIKDKTLSGFLHAMTFFKNLEKSSAAKRRLIGKKRFRTPEVRRRLSLDFLKEKKNEAKIGGSLRLPKTSERFSITKIYFDIMKNGRGSFKGSANSKAVSATLASITKGNNSELVEDESESCIEYDMFFNKQKTKKRKSVRSLFDIHY